jgi:spoIIIJ-associated protein
LGEGAEAVAHRQAEGIEATGATVEAAVAAGLAQLGVGLEAVSVEVVSRPASVLPGERVSGGGEARVRLHRIDEHTMRGRAVLVELLERMGVPATVSVRRSPSVPAGGPAQAVLDIAGDDLGLLIGWRGETLRALQTVVNLMMGDVEAGAAPSGEPPDRRVILDVERYRLRREEQVRELALRLANRVKRTGQRYTLDPMHAYERRAIHMTLAEDPGVRTESMGRDPARRVVISPTGPAQPDLPELPDRFGRPPHRGDGGGRRDRGQGAGAAGSRPRWSRF